MLEEINRIFNSSRDGGDIEPLVIYIEPLVIFILLLDFFGVVVAEVDTFDVDADDVVAFDEVEAFDEIEAFDIFADDVNAFDTFFGAAVFLVAVNVAAGK